MSKDDTLWSLSIVNFIVGVFGIQINKKSF